MGDNKSDRKLLLYATACCRWSRSRISRRDIYLRALEHSEAVADGALPNESFAIAEAFVGEEMVSDAALAVDLSGDPYGDHQLLMGISTLVSNRSALDVAGQCSFIKTDEHLSALQEVFGNPFRPVSFDPRWRTSDVVDVARGIYEDKAFERMPILADALMDAGCEDEQIIGHC